MQTLPLFNPAEESLEKFLDGQVILFDKPLWWTSFDLVRKSQNIIRQKYKLKKLKVGHAGTLDPLATGLMIICTGKATKSIQQLLDADKEYIATIEMGRTTPSFDLETQTDAIYPFEHITKEDFSATLENFLGENQQIPPLFSAKKVDGKRAYTLAREGIDIELSAKQITISELEIIKFELPTVVIRMRCSKGTYVRAFARDIGKANQSGACLIALQRTAIGDYSIEKSLSPELFEKIMKITTDR
jgi:tRNA pseudouridine55 synthase